MVLGAIAFVVKTGSDRISITLEEAGLVQSLIADLSTREERTRQDVALIALDHYMGPEDSNLVAQIAERLFLDAGNAESIGDEQWALGSKAFEVLERRDPERAAALRAQVLAALSDSATRTQARTSSDTTRVASYRPTRPTQLAALVRRNVVYIQYGGAATGRTMNAVRDSLQAAGFVVPETERVTTTFRSAVRYFHAEDRSIADSVAAVTRRALSQQQPPVLLGVQGLVTRGASVPRGQVEVWISS